MKLPFLLILALLYFGTDIGLSWWFRRKFSKESNFIGKNAPNDVQRYFGKAVYFTMVYYLLMFVYLAIHFDFWSLISNVSVLDNMFFETVGFVLGLAFLLLMIAARLNLGSSWRVGLDCETAEEFVTTGFYRFMRNPYFTFFLGFQFSLILIAPNAIMMCSFVQSAILLGLQARHEEAFLQEKYGERYVSYKQTAGRFFPRISRGRRAESLE